jgi:oligopeptide/dipeptide ABC transporter ATP-binding protein
LKGGIDVPVSAKKDVLSIRGLEVHYATERGVVRAVRKVDLTVGEGEIVGLVGESGCGKSATLLSVMRLLPYPGKVVAGQVLLDGTDVLKLSMKDLRPLRGKAMAMVFQDPMSTLNPAHKVERQLGEAIRVHGRTPARGDLIRLLEEVGIASPEDVLGYYPHQLSGGMQQRVMIAAALACRPRLILADEPTTALDVTIEAQILDLLRKINKERGTAIVLVTHNLAVASQFCHRIAVMYAGQIVEEGPVADVLSRPLHPYTRGLVGCIPRFQKGVRLTPIPGQVPDLAEHTIGCSFRPRCSKAVPICGNPRGQDLLPVGRRWVRCERWNAAEYGDVAASDDMGWS